MTKIKIAYVGGGSKQWARVFMNDLALADGMSGEIALYDIDREAAERNKRIGERLNQSAITRSKFHYTVAPKLDIALSGAHFVVLSILPGTFEEMKSDVHAPERYGVWQSVGDTTGPGGVLRAMRTVPIYEGFAKKIKEICPKAWTINFTNPMTVCTKTLTDHGLKAFGCCHEVFHAQEFLARVAEEAYRVSTPARHEIKTDVSGVNHFTWITAAEWRGHVLMAELPAFLDRHYDEGFCEQPAPARWDEGWFNCGNRVKMDLFRRFGALGAAGDRHLAEFMPGDEYLASPEAATNWQFTLTPVSWRVLARDWLVNQSITLAAEAGPLDPEASDEEAVDLMRALLGLGDRVSNVNAPNIGQMPALPMGAVVETNCRFAQDTVAPLRALPLPEGAAFLVKRASTLAEALYQGIKARDLFAVREAFAGQPAVVRLSQERITALFLEMIRATRSYLEPDWDVSETALARLEKKVF
ncbi:MAG TPA: alpha-glucosidase/alpha-galactosidase [Acholeplasmatales bacterium]|nr:MAG: alpha-glucosidase/alpha-galactosidase [Tenericutes bacterium GWF2_57_13]HAQ55890.1 alpha-glucosidase/alpha-galactosidase [Acholeplasmatales bacterium]